MNARFYVPSIGRFASADTIVPDPSNPQSYNRFSYVRNNPINLNDPSGHIACEALGTEECDDNGDYVDPMVSNELIDSYELEDTTPLAIIPLWWTAEQIRRYHNGQLTGAEIAEIAHYGKFLHMYVQMWFIANIRPTAQMEVYIPYANGGYGFADLVDGDEIWEVKPSSVYGTREIAQAQLQGYVINRPGRVGSFIPQLLNGGVVLQHPLAPEQKELIVQMDTSPGLEGIIIYRERNRTNSRVRQPSFEIDFSSIKNHLPWMIGIGLATWGVLGAGGSHGDFATK